MKRNEDTNTTDGFVEINDVDEDEVTAIDPEEVEKDERRKEERKEAIEAIKRFADDEGEDEDEFGSVSFKTIMGGDILQSKFFRNQVIFIIFCVALLLLYTANRYSSLQDIIKIDSLQTRFEKVHYEVLTQSSELLNKERQSNVEKRLLEIGDTMTLNNNTPPFALPQKEE